MSTTTSEPDVLDVGPKPPGARRARLLAIALVSLLVGAVAGFLVGHRGADKAPSPSGTASGTVDVTISGLNVPAPSTLAALLYRGPSAHVHPARDGVGGFLAPVSPNDYRVIEPVRAGSPLVERVTVARPIAHLPAGAYTLVIVIAHRVSPYSEWVPAAESEPPWTYGCTARIDVVTSALTAVHVTEVPQWSPGAHNHAPWMLPDCPVAAE